MAKRQFCCSTLLILGKTLNYNCFDNVLQSDGCLLSVARELLVMGGDSAKDQLRALAEGVRM